LAHPPGKLKPVRRPVILISPDVDNSATRPRDRITLTFEYQKEIARVGGFPLIASPFADLETLCGIADGWLITGGRDLPASRFNEADHPKIEPCHAERLANEDRIYRMLADTDIPILGICFGMQFLAVTNGGSLHQHLPDLGSAEHQDGAQTIVTVSEPSRMLGLGLRGSFTVKCFHHQGVNRMPPGWRVCATAQDGTIEAIEEESDRWRFGVQWHPERTPNSEQSRALFKAFVEAARSAIRRPASASPQA
jgi:putative glutamine amidotransferase